MADLSGDRGRGQMLLVGGLAVAVSIVVLVLLLNAAIYTQNVATRGSGVEGDDALEHRTVMVEAAGDLLDAENERDYAARGPLAANVTRAVTNASSGLRSQWVGSVTAASLDGLTLHNGTRIVQDGSRNLTDAAGTATWTVATNATGIREFTITPDRIDGTTVDPVSANGSTRINVTGSNGTWRLHVYDDGGPTLAVKNASEASPTTVCPAFDTGARVDLIEGTVNGTACAGLDFAKGLSPEGPWDVSIVRGNHTAGTYALTANTTAISPNLDGPGSGSSPRWEPRVYSAALDLSYRTPELRYESRVRVIPGEDDE